MALTRKAAVLGTAVAVAVPLVAAAPATARPLERERVTYENHWDEWCGDVLIHSMVTGMGNVVFVDRGASGLPHFSSTWHETSVFTNAETGLTYTGTFDGSNRDATVTDNGDGTLSIVVQIAGVSKWYDAAGKVLYIDSGMQSFELLVDHAGTPEDPYDDGEAIFVGEVVGLTGRSDTVGRDWCTDLLEVTG